jgi:hypothetical protein
MRGRPTSLAGAPGSGRASAHDAAVAAGEPLFPGGPRCNLRADLPGAAHRGGRVSLMGGGRPGEIIRIISFSLAGSISLKSGNETEAALPVFHQRRGAGKAVYATNHHLHAGGYWPPRSYPSMRVRSDRRLSLLSGGVGAIGLASSMHARLGTANWVLPTRKGGRASFELTAFRATSWPRVCLRPERRGSGTARCPPARACRVREGRWTRLTFPPPMRRAGEPPDRIARWDGDSVEAVNDAVEYEMQLAA